MTQLVIEPPETRIITVVGPDVQALVSSLRMDIAVASSLVIDSPEMLAEAQDVAGRILGGAEAIEEERKARVRPLIDEKAWLDNGYGTARDYLLGLVDGEGGLRGKIIAWNRAEYARAEKAAAEQRAAQAKAAEEAAAAAAKKLADANVLVQESAQAAAAGNDTKAVELVNQATRMADEAHVQASTAVATFVPAAPAAVSKGASEKWRAVIEDKIPAVVFIAKLVEAGDMTLLDGLDLNQRFFDKLAGLQKNAMKIPGILAAPVSTVAIRKKK